MKIIKVDLPKDVTEIELHIFADEHIGDEHCDLDRLKERIKYVSETPNAYCLLNGDILDNATKTSIGDTYTQEFKGVVYMTDRDRLIELKRQAVNYAQEKADERGGLVCIDDGVDYLLANGVIVPPCKVGDKIYQTDGVRIYESTINEITFTTQKMICVTENIAFDETAVGKSIFLTKEEAEQKLKELGK